MNKTSMRERVGRLSEYWYVGSTSAQLKANRPISVVIMETRIVLWRKKDGNVAALRDRCSHRNAFLSKGAIKKDCIKCPYHGWTFDAQGNCVNVPSEGSEGKAFSNRNVEKFPVIEQEGLIWIWMGKEKKPDPKKQPFPMPFYNTKGWKTYYMVTPFENGVTNLVENFMDVPHTVFVHQGWFRDRSRKKVQAIVERTEDSVLVTYDQKSDSIGFADRILNPKKLPMYHTDNFYMPNNTRVDYVYGDSERGFVITSSSTPVSEFKSMVFTCISYSLGVLQSTARLWFPWYTRQVIEQDVEIMAEQGASLQEEAGSFKSTPADTLHLFIESLRDWEASDSKSLESKPKPITREIEFWI